jgi:hypothetical protein
MFYKSLSNGRMIMNNGLEIMRKEVVVSYFKVLSQFYGGNEEVHKLHQTE